MTSRSFRAIMAQAGLTDADLERERIKSQRDAANTAGLVNAAGTVGNGLLGGAFKALDVYRGGVANDAESAADQAIANHVSDAGDDVDTPEAIAAKEADKIEQPSEGTLGGVLDALGGRKIAEAKAKARATQGIATEVKANSDKAKATQKAADDEAGKIAREEQKQRDAEEAVASKAEHDSSENEAERQNRLEIERMREDAKAKAKGTGTGAPKIDKVAKDKREDADSLRNEFNKLPIVKDYNESTVTLTKMRQAAKNNSPAADMTLIYTFNKLQDPGSTVRESEFKNVAAAGDLGDKIHNLVTQVANGERLTSAQRADLLGQGRAFFDATKQLYDVQVKRYGDIANRRGAPLEDIIPDVSGLEAGANIVPRDRAAPPPATAFDWSK